VMTCKEPSENFLTGEIVWGQNGEQSTIGFILKLVGTLKNVGEYFKDRPPIRI
jgi:hypothetical protein